MGAGFNPHSAFFSLQMTTDPSELMKSAGGLGECLLNYWRVKEGGVDVSKIHGMIPIESMTEQKLERT